MFVMFATVSEVLELDSTSSEKFRALECGHLGKLEVELKGYFLDLKVEDLCFLCDPFGASPKELPAGNGMQEDPIDLQHDKTAWEAYHEKTLCKFSFCMLKSYERVTKPAFKCCCYFQLRGYVCRHFHCCLASKQNRSGLRSPEHDLRCAATTIALRIDDLVRKKNQVKISHYLYC